jgi:hypothetical protein
MTADTITASVPGGQAQASVTISPAVLPVFGIPDPVTNSGGTSWSSITAALGPVAAERYYFTPAQNVPSSSPALQPGATRLAASFKPLPAAVLSGSLDSALAVLFSTVRPGDFWTAWHEGEAHVDTPADLIALLTRCYGLFRANAPASARFGQIAMSFTASGLSSHGPLAPWLCCPANGGAALDFLGIDVYPLAGQTFGQTMAYVESGVSTVMLSPSWAITETNTAASGTLPPDSYGQQFFADAWAWSQANEALALIPYFGNSPLVFPPGPLTLAELAAVNAASKA